MRTVLYGHAAYYASAVQCTVPANTTLTLYAPSGALLDKVVADALANGEQVTNKDLEPVKDDFYFISHQMDVPADGNPELLNAYPIVLKAGDKVPNFFLKPAAVPEGKTPLFPTPSQTVNVAEKTNLNDLLELYKGHDIHWAACSFAKEPNAEAIGYGYGYKFKNESPLNGHYAKPPLTEEERKKKRAERFGTVAAASSSSSSSSSPAHKVRSDNAQLSLSSTRERSHNRRGAGIQHRDSRDLSGSASVQLSSSTTRYAMFRPSPSERKEDAHKRRYSPYQ